MHNEYTLSAAKVRLTYEYTKLYREKLRKKRLQSSKIVTSTSKNILNVCEFQIFVLFLQVES